MSEISNHNLASEFRKHPDNAYWLLNKVLPAMEKHFEEFDIEFVISTLTDESMTPKKIRQNYNQHQKKQTQFDPKITRARPAYQFFCDANRAELKEKNPDINFGDVNKMLGDMWANLDKKSRKQYDKEAEKDKERYQKAFQKAEDEAIANGSYTPDPYKNVKKARTSYLCFSTDQNIRNKFKKKAGNDIKELMKLLGTEWRKMGEEERQPYVELADEDKARYMKEKAAATKKHEKLQASLKNNQQNKPESDAEADVDGDAIVDDNENDNDNDEVHVPAKKVAPKKKSKPVKKLSKGKKSKKSVSSDEEPEEVEADAE